MKAWLALLVTMPLLAVGSGGTATAGTSVPARNGLIAASGSDGIYLFDAERAKAGKVPGTFELGAPAWSPDGSLLAVEGWGEGGSHVYTIRPDGSDRRLVLEDAWSPSWSPDGKRLVVVREGENGGVLVTVGVDGSDASELTFNHETSSEGANEPAWSPDGKWIAFFGGTGAVNLVSPEGGDDVVRRIDDGGTDSGWNLAWSPDGSKLAFDTAGKDFRQEIIVVDLATDRRTTLPSRTRVSGLAWSPDGKQLAFLSMRPMPHSSGGCGGGDMDLWTMGVDGSKPHRLGKGSYGPPSWGTFQRGTISPPGANPSD